MKFGPVTQEPARHSQTDFPHISVPVKRGTRLSSTKAVTPTRGRRFLREMGVSPAAFKTWTGFDMRHWVEANPGWSEREFGELVAENLPFIEEPNWEY